MHYCTVIHRAANVRRKRPGEQRMRPFFIFVGARGKGDGAKTKKRNVTFCVCAQRQKYISCVFEPRKLVLDGTQISRCPGREGDDGRRCRDVLSAHCSHVSMLRRGEWRPLSLSLSLLISTCFMHTESNEKGNMCSYASYSERVSVFWGQTH